MNEDLMDPAKLRRGVDEDTAYWLVHRLCDCFTPDVPYLHVAHVEYASHWEAIVGYAKRFGLPPSAISSMQATRRGSSKATQVTVGHIDTSEKSNEPIYADATADDDPPEDEEQEKQPERDPQTAEEEGEYKLG